MLLKALLVFLSLSVKLNNIVLLILLALTQMAKQPLLEDVAVSTALVIGP
jgi:hypothetical protein